MRVVKPRDYQEEALAANREARANGAAKVTNVLASGLGKTVLAGLDIREFLCNTDLARPRILVLNGNIQLLKQIEEEFREKVFGHEYSYGVFNGTEKTGHATDFLFATFDSMYSHLKEFKPRDFGYIFIDEAHHAQANTYSKVIKHFHPERQLSVTATPKRMDGKDITEICGPVVYSLELEEAIARGLTAGVDYRLCLDEIEKIQAFLDNGEAVSWNKLNTEIFVPKRDEEIIATVQRDIADLSDPTTIYFCRSIRHANRIAKLLPDATVVHSNLSVKEVDRRLRKFRHGEIKTIVAVDMLNEGIDIPRTDVVVFLRSTRSWTVFLQQLGRGLRLAEGKGAVRVYDFVGTANALEKIIDLEQRVGEFAGKCGSEEKPNFELKINASRFIVDKVDIVRVLNNIRDYPKYTREELLESLRNYYDSHGRVPLQAELCPANGMPSHETYRLHFGSLPLAFYEAGLITEEDLPKKYTKEEIIEDIRAKATDLGKTPTKRDFSKLFISQANKHFGSYNNAVVAAGLKPNKQPPVKLNKAEMLEKLRRKAEELGHSPTCAEVDGDPDMPMVYNYNKRFGSFNNAARLAGLSPNKRYSTDKYNKEYLKAALLGLAERLGRTPNAYEMGKKNGTPSSATYAHHFGSWNNALDAVGLKVNQRMSPRNKNG